MKPLGWAALGVLVLAIAGAVYCIVRTAQLAAAIADSIDDYIRLGGDCA